MSEKQKKILNTVLTVVFIVALVVFMITFAIGLPIYCRFFYYIQIRTLDLPSQAARYGISATAQEIRQAYDEVLNFCTLPNQTFSSGIFKFTESEAGHFADCKVLFDLNFWGLLCSGIVALTLLLLNRFKVIAFRRPFGHRPQLLAAVISVALPLLIVLLVVIVGFDKAFEVFHSIFFPGKSNWTFNPYTEQIITVMPEEFFMNCAIIIVVGLITFAASLIVADVVLFKREKRMQNA